MLRHDEQIDTDMLRECEDMIKDIDDYFQKQEDEHKQNLQRKNYKSVQSRINTNLKHVNQR